MKPLRRRQPHPQIPLVSTADVAFLLLIFFLSTAVFGVERGLVLALPATDPAYPGADRIELRLAIEADASMRVDGRVVGIEELRRRLRERGRSGPESTVEVRVHPQAPYAAIVTVLDEVKLAGIRRIAIVPASGGGGS